MNFSDSTLIGLSQMSATIWIPEVLEIKLRFLYAKPIGSAISSKGTWREKIPRTKLGVNINEGPLTPPVGINGHICLYAIDLTKSARDLRRASVQFVESLGWCCWRSPLASNTAWFQLSLFWMELLWVHIGYSFKCTSKDNWSRGNGLSNIVDSDIPKSTMTPQNPPLALKRRPATWTSQTVSTPDGAIY